MLRTASELDGYALLSGEEKVGKLEDFYVDDRFWTVRYLAVDTGGWLVQHRTLISPRAVSQVDGLNETIATDLTRAQIEESPTPDERASLDRQFDRLQGEGLRLARDRVALSLAAYESGRADLSTALAARRDLLEAQLRVVDLDARRSDLRAQLAYLKLEQ